MGPGLGSAKKNCEIHSLEMSGLMECLLKTRWREKSGIGTELGVGPRIWFPSSLQELWMLLVLRAAPETCLLRSPALVSLCVPQVSPMDTYFYSHLLLLFLFSVIVPDPSFYLRSWFGYFCYKWDKGSNWRCLTHLSICHRVGRASRALQYLEIPFSHVFHSLRRDWVPCPFHCWNGLHSYKQL